MTGPRLTGWHRHKGSWPGEVWPDEGCRETVSTREPMHVFTSAEFEAIVAARVAEAQAKAIEQFAALADEWDRHEAAQGHPYQTAFADGKQHAGSELRAAIACAAPAVCPHPIADHEHDLAAGHVTCLRCGLRLRVREPDPREDV